jgi:hypothetical protein
VRVQNRHIIYVQGYDPRGLARYYRMFRTELRKFDRLYQLKTTISRPQDLSDGEIASWRIETRANDWQTCTAYDFLRFEDFIKRDLAQPIWKTVFSAVWVYLQLVFGGTITRFARANWRFATFVTYPYLVLLAEALCAAGVAWLFRKGLDAVGVPDPFSMLAAAALFVALLGTALKYTEERTYALYLLRDHIWTWEFAHRRQPEWDRRIDRFAEHLCKVARTSRAEEIVLVGHSSGSFLAVEILARALKLDPVLARQGPRVMLLTVGGNCPVVGYHAAAQHFRDHLRELAVEPSIDWIDCQARKDVMNFFQFDPVAAHGIDVGDARCNPTIVPVRFREIIAPEHYNAFRWQFFRVHFQFVMANDRPHPYDFFMVVCGPVPLRERMAVPDAALAVATGDPAAREFAWRRLENTAPCGQNSAEELGDVEPAARSRG